MIHDEQKCLGKAILIAATFCSLFLLPTLESAHAGENDSTLPTEIISEDGSPMVLVPEGEFIMGRVKGPRIRKNEQPQHTVFLDTFYIDKYEVTNSRYAKYVEENGGGTVKPAYHPTNMRLVHERHADIPVTSIMWKSAKGYCEWAGKRLPTEAEWEKAARGTDGRLYPWGNTPPTDELTVFEVSPQHWAGPNSFSRVDSHPKGVSPYGAHHMSGNAFEWVNDIYLDEYYNGTPLRNPQGPPKGTMNRHGKVLSSYTIRGGSARSLAPAITTSFRAGWSHIYFGPHGGFRCAKSIGDTQETDGYGEGMKK